MASPSSPPPESGNVAHDVEQRAARGGVVTAMGQATRAVASGAGTLLLMRLLTPSDFGLVGMIVAITGFFDLLKDFGLTSATVQRERIEHDEVSALFWINFAIGIALMLLNAAMAPVVALVYGRSELLPLTLALSTASALGALPLQHEALLRRELRFEPIAWIATTSAAAASIASVLAALGGLGAWALVIRQLVRLGVRASLLWIACRWRPSRPKRVNVRELVKFGAHVSGFQLTNYFERNFDNLLVGRFLGPQALGFYTKAYEVMRLPLDEVNRPLGTVVTPTLSRLLAAPDRYRAVYVSVVRTLLLFTVPLAPLSMFMAPWLIPSVLGHQWVGAVPVYQWLALGLVTKPVLNTTIWIFISQGRTSELLRWGIFATTVACIAFAVGLPWGAVGVAMAYTLSDFVIRAPTLLTWIGRRGAVRTRDILACGIPAWICSAVLSATYWALDTRLSDWSEPARVSVCAPASLLLGYGVVALTRSGREALVNSTRVFASLRRKRP